MRKRNIGLIVAAVSATCGSIVCVEQGNLDRVRKAVTPVRITDGKPEFDHRAQREIRLGDGDGPAPPIIEFIEVIAPQACTSELWLLCSATFVSPQCEPCDYDYDGDSDMSDWGAGQVKPGSRIYPAGSGEVIVIDAGESMQAIVHGRMQ